MADVVISENEIELAGTRFPIRGQVKPYLISQYGGKVTLGDYTKDSEQIASNWIMTDFRGGLLCEEMDEATQLDRYWWSTLQTAHKGYLPLPPLVTQLATLPVAPSALSITDGGLENWINTSNLTSWTETYTEGCTITQDTAYEREGTYCAKLYNAAGGTVTIYQDVNSTNDYAGLEFTFTAYCRPTDDGTTDTMRIALSDGVTTTYSSYHSGGVNYEQLTVTATMGAASTGVRVICESGNAAAKTVYYDGAMTLSFTAPTIGTPGVSAEFNGNLYMAFGRVLAKLNTTSGTAFDYVAYMPATITALISSLSSMLYIFQGDAGYYVYMSTAEVFVITTAAGGLNAQYGIHWSAKLFKINTSGQLQYATTPNSATPAWTGNGLLPLATSDCQGLEIYRDATGNEIIYASTKQGWWAHDYTNAKWLQTLVRLPSHTYGGKGFVNWHDAAYISSGLEVKKYVAGSTATITSVGLNRDDGLPIEYQGEIVALIRGYDYMYALVDSSLVTGTGYSGVYEYDGLGWRNIWSTTSADKTMTGGIVSSVKALRLWFDHNGLLYWMPLSRTNANPVKDTTSTYGTAGAHYTGWFDAGTAHDKVALRFEVECKGLVASNETIAVTYRINHTYTDIATGWTTLTGTIATDGETSTSFASGAGLTFREIQFKVVLAGRGTTYTPIILRMNLVYLKVLDTKWGWNVLVDCAREYKGNTSAQLDTALKTIIETKTLSDFTFRDESGGTLTYKVKVANASGAERTGEDWRNTYQLLLISP